MRIADFCIRRPVFATVINLVVVLVGVIAYQRLTVREYPNIDEPVITVSTHYRGASADVMESQVTQVLEESLAGIEGVSYIKSSSRSESSQITINFNLKRDIDAAASDVRDRVSRVRGALPDAIDEPEIAKVEADAQPIIWVTFTSDIDSPLQISDYVDRYVKNRLQTLSGVSQVRIFGERKPSMRIWLDPLKLAAYKITTQDVEAAIRRQNVEIPAGRVESKTREFTIVSETSLNTPEEFESLIIGNQGHHLVRLAEIGKVEVAPYDDRIRARFNGKNSIALGIIKQSVANPLSVSEAVRSKLPEIEKSLPDGMNLTISYDSSVFIDKSIENVFHTIIEAIVLVLLVIFFFLRSVRATAIPVVTIPVSLIGACAVMYALNFSVNTLTLLSFVLAIGLVVDDAIVMLENIYRHIEDGMKPIEAAIKGSSEIGFAVIAMTITLAAVYVPVALQTGRTGRLFTEFALTLAGAVLVSGFVAITLSPMMCSRMLKHIDATQHGAVYRSIEAWLNRLTAAYGALLSFCMSRRKLVVIGVCFVAGSAYFLFSALKSELAPTEDRGIIFAIGIAPEGSTVDYASSYAERMEEIFAKFPDVKQYFTLVGYPTVSNIFAPVILKPWEERKQSQMAIANQMAGPLFGLPGILSFAGNPPSLGQPITAKAVEIEVLSPGSYEELNQTVQVMLDKARQDPRLRDLDTDLKLSKPELKVMVDRDKAADLGISVQAIGQTIETFFGGRDVTRYKKEGKQYDVVVKAGDESRKTPEQTRAIFLRSKDGTMVPLSNLGTVRESVAPRELIRWNQLHAATITANVNPPFTAGDGLKAMEAIAAETMPNTMQIDYAGLSREFKISTASGYITFILALAFIYLVLAAQFESFIDPLIIMVTVPLSMTGALLALKLTGGTMNVYSQIGLITLIGLITKHGILIVEFANQRQHAGLDRTQAVIESALLRLRPILMTTGAMVLGAVPLALASGAGSESRHAIGWVIVGGMTFGSVLTLFVVPVVYSLVARRRHGTTSGEEPHRSLHVVG